ncbi:sulfatase-like hydrolase/transferase, partial [candidate division CSSED10-310 bacterium]
MRKLWKWQILCSAGLSIIMLFACRTGFESGAREGKDKIQIILISIDTLRGDHLGTYGYPRDTSPWMNKLARDSVLYTKAYPNGCWTMPSHVSLFTGTLPSRHFINKDWNGMKNRKYPELNKSLKNIAELLKSHHI